jgi:hypothetical protein
MAERVKIGTKTLTKAQDLKQSYETAAWSKTVRCEPQTVDVFAEVKDGKVVDTSIGWSYTGTVTDANFPSLFGGVAVTDGKRPEEIGKEETIHLHPYAHAIALSLLGQADSLAFDLKLEVTPLYVPFRSHDGQGSFSAGLYTDPTKEQREQSQGVAAALASQSIPDKSPNATFGWAMAKQAEARNLIAEAKRTQDMADYALRQYAPEFAKPEISTLEPTPAL